MKDYGRLILWLDYFNSALSRSEGRRVPLNQAVRHPSLEELEVAVKRLGYSPLSEAARYPRRSLARSGYVSIEKRRPKSAVLKEVAPILASVRGESRRGESGRQG